MARAKIARQRRARRRCTSPWINRAQTNIDVLDNLPVAVLAQLRQKGDLSQQVGRDAVLRHGEPDRLDRHELLGRRVLRPIHRPVGT